MITVCKDCPKRHPGCHEECEWYKAERKALDAENKRYNECGGYSDFYQKEIHVRRYKDTDADLDEMSLPNKSMKMFEEKSLRHELVHAFMYESGLDVNSHNIEAWARDEEMIDWMAIQMPKIMTAYDSIIKHADAT